MSLTDEQQHVVECADGFNMVCALPGSGKTHTSISITERIIELSSSYSVVMVTFTKAAAKEMQGRVNYQMGKGSPVSKDVVQCSTFHSLILKQWRDYRPGFKLLMGPIQASFVNRALNNVEFEGNYEDAMTVIEFYGQMLHPKQDNGSSSEGWDLYNKYVELVRANKFLDFQMVFRNVILGMREGVLPPLPFTHMICDEFQDTDNVQYAWIKEHAKKGIKVTTVGDDDQSIYGFRGSEGYAVMKRFQDEFDAIGHVLSMCFRCKPEILAAAQKVVEINEDRVPKDMKAFAEPGGEVHIYGSEINDQETQRVLDILEEHEGQEFAILARNNRQLDEIEGALKNKGIKYNRENNDNFWELPQVDSFLKILYSIAKPYDTRYINEVLGFLEEDEEEIAKATKLAKRSRGFFAIPATNIEMCRPTTKYLHKIFIQLGSDTEDEEMIRKRMDTLINIIADAKGKKDGQGLAVAKAVKNILVKFGKGSLHERIDDMVYRLRPKREKDESEMSEEDKDRAVENARIEAENRPKVTLSTFHGSKGLEWPNVILAGVSDGVMPSPKCTSFEEERRLLYVGMTRAENRLYMLWSRRPSVYLLEAFPLMFEQFLVGKEDDNAA